jgi:polyadenylation factor subunit 2
MQQEVAGPFRNPDGSHQLMRHGASYDGKRMRKAIVRRTVDYNAAILRYIEMKGFLHNDRRCRLFPRPDPNHIMEASL